MTKNNAFFKTWVSNAHRYINPLAESESRLDLLKNQQFIDLMERAPCVVFIINHATSRYEFFSKNVKAEMGYTAEEMLEGGVALGMSVIDESHHEPMGKYIIPNMFTYFSDFAERKELKKVKVAYNFKFRRKDGQVRWTLHQMSVIETDESGGPLLSMVFMSDVTALKKDDRLDFSISKLNDEGFYDPIFTTSYPDDQPSTLTLREWDIVSLINSGKTSAEMAEKLFLSEHTVKNHRKNILRKFEASNTAHLLDICRRKGIL